MQNEMLDIKQKLLLTYKYKIELHAHTKPTSSCSEITPEEMVKLYSNLGYDGIVITNHFTPNQFFPLSKEDAINEYYRGYEDTEKAAENSNLKVYFGAEIRFVENMNDYLVYGLNKEILSKIYDYLPYDIKTFRENVVMNDSLLIQAHPFRDCCSFVDARYIDGVETLNLHPGHNSRVGVAIRHASKAGLKITTAGSDCHHFKCDNEGVAAVRVKEMPKDSFELADILKSGDYIFELGDNVIVLP